VFSNAVGSDDDTVKPGLAMILDPFGRSDREPGAGDDVIVALLTPESSTSPRAGDTAGAPPRALRQAGRAAAPGPEPITRPGREVAPAKTPGGTGGSS